MSHCVILTINLSARAIPRHDYYIGTPMSNIRGFMQKVSVPLSKKVADGYVIPLGPANLVAVITDVGLVGCGAFDVAALDSFSYPAAKVRPAHGPSIVTTNDILTGIVKEANRGAMSRGITNGMTGKQALELL